MIKNQNIKILYFLTFCNNSLFWYGIWVFYYLLFTNYAGIGFLESIMIFSFIIFEIPSGAFSDLIGKKKTLSISFLFMALGSFVMAIAQNYIYLLISVILLSVASASYSGTIESIAYQSLDRKTREKKYLKVISNITTIEKIAVAGASILGGFLFTMNSSLPFYLTSIIGFVGFLSTFLLKEPKLKRQNVNFSNFVKQIGQGLKELTKTSKITKQTILFLSIAFFSVICYEILNDVLAVEFGFKPEQLGIFLGVLSLIAATASQFTVKLEKYLNSNILFIILGTFIAITLIFSPYLGLILGGISLILRVIFQVLFRNLTSVVINRNTSSKFRATTLSTFSFLRNMPYIIIAYYVGYLMDFFSGKVFALFMGILLLIVLFIQLLFNKE